MPRDISQETARELLTAVQLVLDAADYTTGVCRFTEMVAAVLPREILIRARNAANAATKEREGGA